jgi:hypothetical protein
MADEPARPALRCGAYHAAPGRGIAVSVSGDFKAEALHAGRRSFGAVERRADHGQVVHAMTRVQNAVARAERMLVATGVLQSRRHPVEIIEMYV